ncbi:MAG: prohibitin family protein [candidate division Zixibacteria bacterium]|nr:prohibitin family protein [candidate division Zixibacteria bacterium]MDH3937314.1 prohibitin family protein [candidate division Zixibacteria bacterium]MDH4033092.1 prohibitin family protein [candidate division Zixibacteria bacterium]
MSKTQRMFLPLVLIALFAVGMVGCGSQIPSGHRGVFYYKFGGGTELGKIYDEGFIWHLPWNSMFVYKTQLQENKEGLTVLSSDGATIQLEVSILYRPLANHIDSLQVSIGPNYYNVSIAPSIRTIARTVAGRYKPEEIYSTKREEMGAAIVSEMQAAMADKFLEIENVLIRDVKIPAKITEAINFKLTADQEAQRKMFEIEKEKLEADRKRVEAKGIADFQKIVATGITPSYLKWKGIEATLTLAESQNSKVVIIGSGKDGMPLILGGDK